MSDEIREEQLDAPLVVHKKTDASYQDGGINVDMSETHIEEEKKPTLERHRFKKDPNKKSNKAPVAILIIVIIAVAFCALYFTGNISFGNKSAAKTTTETTTETTTSLEEAYAGTIVIKGTYIFVDAQEVDGIEGLQESLKYTDKSTTAYKIIDEDADSNFLNNDVLPLLMDMGFYDKNTEIVHQGYTGLMAAEETTTSTTVAPTTQAQQITQSTAE